LAFYFSLSFLFGLISDSDENGKYTAYISSALALSSATGPALFGVIKDSYNDNMALYSAATFIILGSALAVFIEKILKPKTFNL
jgi:predicted MFS family arabinose efflux permease